jgi:3-deoxy-D-manno-octulosonic-acid transferase
MSIKGYNTLLYILLPFILFFFFLRVLRGKEDKNRFYEKLCFSLRKRPSGNIIWIHACSVGEVKSTYNLIKKFLVDGHKIIVTTNTYLSAVDVNKKFSNKVIHQYLPLDFNFLVIKFLKHWKPSKAIFVESELWPNLIFHTNRLNIPLCLIQARLSNKSIQKWRLVKELFKDILEKFSLIIPQSLIDKKKIEFFLNYKIKLVANLKFSSEKLKFSKKEKEKLIKNIKKKVIISAISTHAGEENILINQINSFKNNKNNLFIIQPRHPDRTKKIISIINKHNLSYKQRSIGELPDKRTSIYLFDTFGESGLLMSISDIVIIGGTLVPVGGHNPIEAAQFGKAIIIGPYTSKIEETIKYLSKHNSIKLLKNKKELRTIILELIANKKQRIALGANVKAIILKNFNASSLVYKEIGNIK